MLLRRGLGLELHGSVVLLARSCYSRPLCLSRWRELTHGGQDSGWAWLITGRPVSPNSQIVLSQRRNVNCLRAVLAVTSP